MESFFQGKGHHITQTPLYESEDYPGVDEIDWLIVMGGPMGVYDEPDYTWLRSEKAYIIKVIAAGKMVLGICLGAQLIADALGAKVYKNKHCEIGWFQIDRSSAVDHTILSDALPERIDAFHWHSDTFDIPDGAQSLGRSEACQNQGFILNNRIVGFQFHLETTLPSARSLIENCRDELDASDYVQTENEMLADEQRFNRSNELMFQLVECLAGFAGQSATA